MNHEKMRDLAHKGIDRHCASLTSDPYRVQRVLHMAHQEGDRVVKRRFSLGLVLVLILVLTGTVALAATLLWQDYVPRMKQAEYELGDYADWPAARRVQLAKDIAAMGYLEESEDVRILSIETTDMQDRVSAADRLLLKLTGQEDVKEIHSALITYAIMEHEDTWTAEQRAWWNGILNDYADTGTPDTLIAPAKNDLTEAEAIAIAKDAIQKAYHFDDVYMDSLHAVANLYVTEQRPDYKRWDVQLKKYRDGTDRYLEKVYCAVVDENGEVIADPDVEIAHPAESAAHVNVHNEDVANAENPEILRVYEQYGTMVDSRSIWRLTLDEKAEWLGKDNGIPRDEDISEDDAVQIACKRLASIGYDPTDFDTSVWYQVCDSAAVYMIYFIDHLDQPVNAFTVTVDAVTGEVQKTYTPGSSFEP